MTKSRFKRIRSVLSFRHRVTPEVIKNDSLARIRPLIDGLKVTGHKYVEVGRNLALDEASVACRSKYGIHLIQYNKSKPTGKFHFKIYMVCYATSWLALNYRVHSKSAILDRWE